MRTIERNGESELEQKLLTPASQDNVIKMAVVVVADPFENANQMFKLKLNLFLNM